MYWVFSHVTVIYRAKVLPWCNAGDDKNLWIPCKNIFGKKTLFKIILQSFLSSNLTWFLLTEKLFYFFAKNKWLVFCRQYLENFLRIFGLSFGYIIKLFKTNNWLRKIFENSPASGLSTNLLMIYNSWTVTKDLKKILHLHSRTFKTWWEDRHCNLSFFEYLK